MVKESIVLKDVLFFVVEKVEKGFSLVLEVVEVELFKKVELELDFVVKKVD